MDAVVLDHVDKAYTTYGTDIVLTGETRPSRTRQVLRDLSLTIPAGEITVIVGRSGCGKSTLLKLLAGTEMPDTGTIRIPEGWHSAMLSPDPYVITWTSVQRNVAMACGVGKTPEERYERASGGQREDDPAVLTAELGSGVHRHVEERSDNSADHARDRRDDCPSKKYEHIMSRRLRLCYQSAFQPSGKHFSSPFRS